MKPTQAHIPVTCAFCKNQFIRNLNGSPGIFAMCSMCYGIMAEAMHAVFADTPENRKADEITIGYD